jgi:CHAT domain-containing protein/AAA ATPase-like protein
VRVVRLTHGFDGDAHRVEIVVEAPGLARRAAVARFPFAPPPGDLNLVRWYFETYRDGPADVVTGLRARRAAGLLGDLGAGLFRAIFEASHDARQLWAAVQPDLADVRVEIVTSVAGATALPWEVMTHPESGQPLALGAAALVRAHPQAALAPPIPEGQARLRVLLVISRPGVVDVPYRSVAYHLARLGEANAGSLQLDVLRPPTFVQLTRVLQRARERGAAYQIVHFDGHGVWGDAAEQPWLTKVIPGATGPPGRWLVSPGRPGAHGYLLFENPRLAGNVQLVDGPALGRLLADAGVALLTLNACRSALADPPSPGTIAVTDPHQEVRAYGTLAQEVMDNGVAGVLAMRYDFYVATAAKFIADLYAQLVQGRSFGTAVTAARQSLAALPPDANGVTVQDWMVPVAYEAAPLHLASTPAGNDPAARPGPPPGAARDREPGVALPPRPGLGFYGRDNTLLALDRVFDSQPIVLLHGPAGIGKTTTAAEFARWYILTGGIQGPAIYTSLSQHPTVAALAAQLTAALAGDLATSPPLARDPPAGDQAVRLVGQLLRVAPRLWILDDLGYEPGRPGQELAPDGRQELLTLLRSARDSGAKLLLAARDDQQAWLGDLPARLSLPPLPPAERGQLVRAVAASQRVELTGLGATSPVLRALGGNPKTIIERTEAALRDGATTASELLAMGAGWDQPGDQE